jgi:hypothetical protein
MNGSVVLATGASGFVDEAFVYRLLREKNQADGRGPRRVWLARVVPRHLFVARLF